MASDNKTNAELSRSGVKRLNNSSGVLGNSYGAQLEYMNSKTGENPIDNVRDIGTSKSKTNLNASKISISHEHKESSDYHADELSVTADYDTQRGEMPQWRKLLLDPEKAGYFLSRQWPRISLRASFRSKEPYVVPNEDDKNSSVKEEIPRRNKRTVCVVISCVILVILVVIPTVVLTILAKNDNASTGKSYVKARMGITVNSTFENDFENPQSIQYRTFVTKFCTGIGYVYYNGTSENYYGCQVTNLTRGSVVVAFVVYFKQSTTKEEIEIKLKSYVKAASNLLGAFIIQENSVHVIDVVIEILTSPPPIQNTNIEASTSSFEMPTSIYKKTISATSVFNISVASSVIYTYTPKSEISSNVSLHFSTMLGNTLTTNFTQEYLSVSVSSVTPVYSLSVSKQTDQTDSLAGTSTRNIIETASKVTTITKNGLEDHSTIDVSKIVGGTSTFGDFSNDNVVTTMMDTSSLKSSTAVSTLAIPESNQNSYTGTTDNVSQSSITVAATSVPEGILSSPTAVKTESKDPTIVVTTTTGLRDYFTSDTKSVTTTIGDFAISSMYTTFMSTSLFRSSTTGFAPENNQGTSVTDIRISPNVSSSMTIVTKTSLPEGVQSSFTAGETAPIVTTINVPTTTGLADSYAIDVSKSSTSTPSVSLNHSALTTSMPSNSYKSPITDVTLLVPESIPNSFTTGIKIFSNLSPSSTPLATSLPEGILNAPSSFYSTAISKFMTNGITRSLADIISDSVADKPMSFYSSQVFSTISVLSTVTSNSPLKYIPSSLPSSSKEHEIKTDLTYFMPSSVLHDTPLLPSYSESVQMTTSQNSASESILNINRPLTTESVIRQQSRTPVKQITTQTETEMFSVSKAIYTSTIDTWSYNSYYMPRTQIMSPSQSNYKPFTSTVIVLSDTQLMSASTDLYSTRYILPTVASSVLATVSSTVSYFSAGNVQSTKSSLLESSSSVFSTEAQIQDLITCTNVTAELNTGPVTMICTLDMRSNFDKIAINHGPANQPLFAVELFKNGTKNFLKSDSNINANFNVSIVEITFQNILCYMDGEYKLGLVKSFNNSFSWTTGHLLVLSQPEVPTLTLNADQVIDLVFPDGNFYRAAGKHVCEGNIGHPPSSLQIDIMYANGTRFEIPKDSYVEFRNLTKYSCNNHERIDFAIKFSAEMSGASLRCRVPGAFNNGTSQTLTLIPRNFCDCASPSSKYEHPTRCDAFVECIQDNNIMYPFGLLCRYSGLCSNATIGICSQNCASNCMKTKPQDICIPPTTTPAPSPYISCNESMSLLLYSKPPVISCTLNQTSAFESINVTKKSGNSITDIARISRDGAVTLILTNDNLNVTFEMRTITIRLTNISCTDEGVYRVDLNMNGIIATAQTQLSVLQRPTGYANLQLNPDQIADLGYYRLEFEHRCQADIGYPAGQFKIEILKKGETRFTVLNITQSISDSLKDCSVRREMKFGIVFTSDMNEAIIRCRIESNYFPTDPPIYSNNETVSLIPGNFCQCATPSNSYEHPARCDAFVLCNQIENIMYPYGLQCRSDQCSNTTIGMCSNNCSSKCMKTKAADICIPPTTTPAPSPYISCNESMAVILYSKPPAITCTLNQTSAFESINITKISGNLIIEIARISRDGAVTLIHTNDNLNVTFEMRTITIRLTNISCTDEGLYRLDLNMNGVIATAQTQLSVLQRPNWNATLRLHPDQIADLGFYRTGNEHSCKAEIGSSSTEIKVEILKKGETKFSLLNVTVASITDVTINCSITREIKFGIIFSSNMSEAVIRCRIESNMFPSDYPIYSNNETLSLVSNHFCDNKTSASYPHPTDCNKYVTCVGKTPYGQSCLPKLCYNSSTNNCDYCDRVICHTASNTADSTTVPSTTTMENPSAPVIDISCNESMFVILFSKPPAITCTLNQTSAFESIKVTKISGNSIIEIARILSNGTVIQKIKGDNLNVMFAMGILTISLINATCTDEGVYKVDLNKSGAMASAQTQFTVIQRPNGNATLRLHPDQIADLGFYRTGSEHSCKVDIGFPSAEIKVEILKKGETRFSLLNVTVASIADVTINCSITREIKFGINFSSNMSEAVIRCRIENNMFPSDYPIYSNNETLSLISNHFCDNKISTSYPHPTDCNKYVTCVGKTPYGQSCIPNLCFNYSTNNCDYCDRVICHTASSTAESTTVPSTTTTKETPSTPVIDMNCTKLSDFIGSGPVYIQCTFQLSSSLMSINISKTFNSTDHLLATVNSNGIVNMVQLNGLQIKYTQTHVSTIHLNISKISCSDEAIYNFVAMQDNLTFVGKEILIAKSKPGTPKLTLSHQTVLNVKSGDSVCNANVGNPAGSIQILVKGENDAEYMKYTGFTETVTKTKLECNTNIELKFSLNFTSQWNNTKVKCQVQNDQVIDANQTLDTYTSNVGTIVLIPDNYCAGSAEYKQDPRYNCTFYIQCDNGRIFSKTCEPLCFNANFMPTPGCDYCDRVNATCNFP